MDLSNFRREYSQAGLDLPNLAPDPVVQFADWFAQANLAGLIEPNAATLSTVGPGGCPSTRTVLLKSFDARGFVFYTNYQSRKAGEIAANPQVALLFAWIGLERQVIIEGRAEPTDPAESAAYFATRPYGSQLGAWVSAQSTITTRAELEAKLSAFQKKYPEGHVPPPPYWGGFRVVPRTWEFWQGRPSRLHDRFRYRRDNPDPASPWIIERLSP